MLAAALLLVACGDAGEQATERAAEASRGLLALEELSTIGCPSCPAEEQLSVFAMSVDESGLIWTVDRYPPHLRIFRQNGELVTASGPTGQGPGDFVTGPMDTMVTGHGILPRGGTALAYQIYPPAFVELDQSGNELRRLPIDVDEPFRRTAFVIVRDTATPDAFMLQYEISERAFTLHHLEVGDSSVSARPIVAVDTLFPGLDVDVPRFSMAIAPDGTLLIAEAFTYRMVRIDRDGTVLGESRHDVPRPLLPAENLDARRRAARRNGEPEDEVDIHENHFFNNALQFDDEGRLWVLVNRPDRSRTTFDIFAADGTHLQQLELPYHVLRYMRGSDPAFFVGNGRLVAPIIGPDEEDRIKVWRIVEGA